MINNIGSNHYILQLQDSTKTKSPSSCILSKTNPRTSQEINFGTNIVQKLFIKPSQEKVNSILSRSKKFGLEEYKQLTPKEKIILSKSISLGQRIDAKGILTLAQTLKQNLAEKFPQGYKFVSIGRTPALFAKILEYQGIESQICPISGLKASENIHKLISPQNLENYGKFLNSQGISKEIIDKDKKAFVFVDYTETGASLHNFEQILAKDPIGIKGNNAIFLSLNDHLLTPTKKDSPQKIHALKHYFLDYPRIKNYPVSPSVYIDQLSNTERHIKKYEQNIETKKLNFCLLQMLDNKKLLKNKVRE